MPCYFRVVSSMPFLTGCPYAFPFALSTASFSNASLAASKLSLHKSTTPCSRLTSLSIFPSHPSELELEQCQVCSLLFCSALFETFTDSLTCALYSQRPCTAKPVVQNSFFVSSRIVSTEGDAFSCQKNT